MEREHPMSGERKCPACGHRDGPDTFVVVERFGASVTYGATSAKPEHQPPRTARTVYTRAT